ncbi:putative LRR receptor-like serine/threonine-protein kinase [Hibiscus syriacus]|uniref:LRR receptor-like serine/threonine-protein kinase n=1 Tax=Hibiscus syriacus TaxID=106335 RepID=A0A6A3BR60_HIBSY|nr:probable LRR receptor-like serine/threonine-protein kinase At2g16250 [Hibiscus syriacus]KAE8719386.1 putative LRR receptor-like serine/threonine-protein kinase [Hibiscus syriacus]
MVDQRSIGLLYLLLLLMLFEFTFEQQVQQTRLSSGIEFAALFELRSSLGLRRRDWPRKVDPCTNWNGIRCENGSVTSINISGFRRTRLGRQILRFAVDSLANFTRLVSFNASRFLLPGSIPDWFGQRLLTLQVLDLRSCNVSGVIPLSIGNLTNLTSLYLSDNRLTGRIPSTLGGLLSLLILDLSKNSLTGSIPSSLFSLRNVTVIDISSNNLAGSIPPGLGSLSMLQSLNLSSNRLTSSIPAQLGVLDSLVDLDISSNGLSGSVPLDLRGLRNLRRMVFGNNGLGGALPVGLFPSPNQLQVIVLKNNSFNGNIPEVLWSIPELNLLDISHNNFTGQLPNSTLNDNAAAAVLNISHNKFYGGLTTVLRRFSFTDLSGNYFEGTVPDYVQDNAFLSTNCLQNVSRQRNLTQCESFYTERGLDFDNFGRPNYTGPPAPERGDSNRRTIVLAAVLGGAGLVVLLILLLVLVLCLRKRRNTRNHRGIDAGAVAARETHPSPGVQINFSGLGDLFAYQQLLEATGDFNDSNLIKHGHSGDLFRGILEGGFPVVVKRIDLQSIKKEAYLSELDFFSKVSHPRIVPLLGHCLERENVKFLVYKYMPNGDLSSSLYWKNNSEDDSLQSLDWITRLKIAIGAAEGLSYLHHECTPPFVHRDVQATSILLDDKFEVRLGSLTEVCAHEDGHQNRITRLLRLPQSSEQGSLGSTTAICAYDVYCFGKVLLGLVTGKMHIGVSSDTQMKEWLEQTLLCISIYEKELVTKILDPSLLVDDDLLEEVWAMAIVARSCLNSKPSRRPQMRYILKALENPLRVVREDTSSSARLRTTSSRGSWNASFFGSWRQSSMDVVVNPAASSTRAEGGSSLKRSGTTGSQGSTQNGGGVHSSSRRRHSREIFPEPPEPQRDIERQDRN